MSADDAERLRNFAQLIRKDGCHIASPCAGCSGSVEVQELVPDHGNADETGASSEGCETASRDEPAGGGAQKLPPYRAVA